MKAVGEKFCHVVWGQTKEGFEQQTSHFSLYMLGFREQSQWRGSAGRRWDSHRMDWRHAETGVNETGNRTISISKHRRNKDFWSGRMMEEERYKSYFSLLLGEGNDAKYLNVVVQVAEKGSQGKRTFRGRIFSLEMC